MTLATVAAVPTLGAASDQTSHEDPYQQGLFLRQKHDWGIDQFQEFLTNRGMDVKSKGFQKEVPSIGSPKDDGGVSVQKLSTNHLDMTLTVSYPNGYNTYNTYVDFHWEITVPAGQFVDHSLPPNDVVEIEWQADEVDPHGDPYGSPGYVTEHPNAPSTKTAGISMAYDDTSAYYDNPNGDDARYDRSWHHYCGSQIKLRNGSPSSRDFYVRYNHSYSNTDYQISWTAGAPSVTFVDNDKAWLADGMAYEEDLVNGKDWDCEVDTC